MSRVKEPHTINQNILSTPLTSFIWDPHVLRCFKLGKLRTVDDLRRSTKASLRKIPGVSGGTLKKMTDFLAEYGFALDEGRATWPDRTVADSFTAPASVLALIDVIQWRAMNVQRERDVSTRDWRFFNKSEVLRAGLAALMLLPGERLLKILRGVPERRRGAPTLDVIRMMEEGRAPEAPRGALIDYVLSRVDFAEMHGLFKRLDLRWPIALAGGKERLRVPTATDLEEKAEELLEVALFEGRAEHHGLVASMSRGVLSLAFVPYNQDSSRLRKVQESARRKRRS